MFRKNRLFLLDRRVINNNVIKDIKDINLKDMSKNRHILILEEQLFIKKIDVNRNDSIDEIIYKSFGRDSDYLYHHFTINKGKTLIIYAVKGGNRVKELCEGANKVKVDIIQEYVIRFAKKNIKEKDWELVFLYRDHYYYINYKNKYINNSYINIDINVLKNKIDTIKGSKIYIDNKIDINNFCDYEIVSINLGEMVNEKKLPI